METFAKTTVDELGRFLLPVTLNSQLGWEPGSAISFTSNFDMTAIILSTHKNMGISCTMDEFFRFTLPLQLRKKLNWKKGDVLSAILEPEEGIVTISLLEKFMEKCVICKSPDILKIIKGSGVCKSCATDIAKSVWAM